MLQFYSRAIRLAGLSLLSKRCLLDLRLLLLQRNMVLVFHPCIGWHLEKVHRCLGPHPHYALLSLSLFLHILKNPEINDLSVLVLVLMLLSFFQFPGSDSARCLLPHRPYPRYLCRSLPYPAPCLYLPPEPSPPTAVQQRSIPL